jgi:hypothetical protein
MRFLNCSKVEKLKSAKVKSIIVGFINQQLTLNLLPATPFQEENSGFRICFNPLKMNILSRYS